MARRLTRDAKNAVLGGVAAGFANYFGVDPVLARLVFILLAFVNGFGLVAYVIGWAIMPRDDEAAGGAAAAGTASGVAPGAATGAAPARTPVDRVVEKVRQAGERVADELQRLPADGTRGRVVAGTILIVLGVLFLLDRFSWWRWPEWARLSTLWPVILIAVGASLILEAARSRGRKQP
ncbi:MAG: hypothetical protein DMF50_10460 [Acidobacteria bacterium]|nr:MAG: hypothetical protein DMF50_10460 [Acidobacteriota bacterium]